MEAACGAIEVESSVRGRNRCRQRVVASGKHDRRWQRVHRHRKCRSLEAAPRRRHDRHLDRRLGPRESSQYRGGFPCRNHFELCADVDLRPVLRAGNEYLTVPIPEDHRERVRLLSLSDRQNAVGPGGRRLGPQAWKDQLDCDRVFNRVDDKTGLHSHRCRIQDHQQGTCGAHQGRADAPVCVCSLELHWLGGEKIFGLIRFAEMTPGLSAQVVREFRDGRYVMILARIRRGDADC